MTNFTCLYRLSNPYQNPMTLTQSHISKYTFIFSTYATLRRNLLAPPTRLLLIRQNFFLAKIIYESFFPLLKKLYGKLQPTEQVISWSLFLFLIPAYLFDANLKDTKSSHCFCSQPRCPLASFHKGLKQKEIFKGGDKELIWPFTLYKTAQELGHSAFPTIKIPWMCILCGKVRERRGKWNSLTTFLPHGHVLWQVGILPRSNK